MAERNHRSLEHLETSASTARVLNLRAIARALGHDPEYRANPLFRNTALNRSIIVKHRLRPGEADMFVGARRLATKILSPIETNDLRIGARYVFIGQRNFEHSLHEGFGLNQADAPHDLRVLSILDASPTLDPFLLRERLRHEGLEPARCYFDLSKADTNRIFGFAQLEIERLVRIIAGGGDAAAHTVKLTEKILANSSDADLEPLRLTMQLDRHQFQDGVFCWKAFLYYKWRLADLLPQVGPVLNEIRMIKPLGPQADETKLYLSSIREALCRALITSCRSVKATLEVYDQAYGRLTEESDPTAFRHFLLRAPDLFNELGDRLGGVDHIASFWRFRFPVGAPVTVSPSELADVFKDFAQSLGFEAPVSTEPGQAEANATFAAV